MRRIGIITKWLGLILVAMLLVWGVSAVTVLKNSVELTEKTPSDLRIATYNVHYIWADRATGPWSVGDWEERKESLAEAMATLETDIIGFQEMETFGRSSVSDTNLTLEWLLAQHPEFTAGATGDPASFPSTQPIFFRSDRFTLQDEGWFFFSATPDSIYSRTFNGSFPAFASWVELTDINTKQTFKVVNIHTDFKSYRNRRLSLELVRNRIEPWLAADETVFVIGDVNAWQGSRLHYILEAAGLTFAPVRASTYHANRGLHLFPAIDHIAYTSNVTHTKPPVVVQKKFLNAWPSDHYPVVVDVALE